VAIGSSLSCCEKPVWLDVPTVSEARESDINRGHRCGRARASARQAWS
jgi:hypothetical protein